MPGLIKFFYFIHVTFKVWFEAAVLQNSLQLISSGIEFTTETKQKRKYGKDNSPKQRLK